MNNHLEVIEAINYMNYYSKNRISNNLKSDEFFLKMMNIIAISLSKWSGTTYVGVSNNDGEIYQEFFKSIYHMIDLLDRNKKNLSKNEKEFIKSIKYCGKIYRILGYGNCIDKHKNRKIKPIFNDKYVSWSKNEDNSYIESKLYGYRTKMYCNIEKPFYGLDLEKYQEYVNKVTDNNYYISRGDEREVVFITKKDFIYDIKYYK